MRLSADKLFTCFNDGPRRAISSTTSGAGCGTSSSSSITLMRLWEKFLFIGSRAANVAAMGCTSPTAAAAESLLDSAISTIMRSSSCLAKRDSSSVGSRSRLLFTTSTASLLHSPDGSPQRALNVNFVFARGTSERLPRRPPSSHRGLLLRSSDCTRNLKSTASSAGSRTDLEHHWGKVPTVVDSGTAIAGDHPPRASCEPTANTISPGRVSEHST
mmetsp:Transcript_50492/g.117233  ORF Transcript_50492/g.117233 Transcript_50492/m.117233 type:complete len:216 (+) Transcript_50492:1690-2337(+)